MQSNLAYQTDGMICYDKNALLCQNLGGLYTWETARRSCPKGWRLPDQKQWEDLVNAWGGFDQPKAFQALVYGGGAFFQAQLAGMRRPDGGFTGLYEEGYYWTSVPSGDRAGMAVFFDKKSRSVKMIPVDRKAGASCRCVRE